MKKEPERLEMDLAKTFFNTAQYHERKSDLSGYDGSCICHVFCSGSVYRGISCERNFPICTSGSFYFMGLDGIASQLVPKKRIFQENK